MSRPRMLIVIPLLTGLMLFSACGGGDSGSDDAEGPSSGIDGQALEESMSEFATEVESEFGFFSAPEYQESDQTLLGYLPTGVDAVVFCDRLSEFVADKGFQDVTISVRVSGNGPELASGVSGEDCSAV